MESESEPQVYLPYRQVEDSALVFYAPKDLAVRSSLPAAQLVAPIRAIIRRRDATLPISDVRLLSDIVDLETASRAMQVRVLGAFAVIAFVLAGIGIHGLLSFSVSQRARRSGVRMALGARPGDILRDGARTRRPACAGGLVPGVALAYVAGGHGVAAGGRRAARRATFAAAIAVAAAMTLAGCLVPTRRALRVDPVQAIRAE